MPKTLLPYLEVVGVLSIFVVLVGQFLECHYGSIYKCKLLLYFGKLMVYISKFISIPSDANLLNIVQFRFKDVSKGT